MKKYPTDQKQKQENSYDSRIDITQFHIFHITKSVPNFINPSKLLTGSVWTKMKSGQNNQWQDFPSVHIFQINEITGRKTQKMQWGAIWKMKEKEADTELTHFSILFENESNRLFDMISSVS